MMKLLLMLLLLIGCGDADNPQIVTHTITNGVITVRASEQFAGAVDSLKYQGVEFLDATDHGRMLQSAQSFCGYGECYNPTEGGSMSDGYLPTSSSRLQAIVAKSDLLWTETQMAFWLRPGESSDCGMARNTQVISDHIMNKTVQIGHLVSHHVIDYQVQFYIPEYYSRGVYEVLTGYMPSEFSSFWRYNPATGEIRVEDYTTQETPLIYTNAENYAMGIYSPGLVYGSFTAAELKTPGVVKWNMVQRLTDVQAGTYGYRCYVIVGSLDEVKDSMTRLHEYLSGIKR